MKRRMVANTEGIENWLLMLYKGRKAEQPSTFSIYFLTKCNYRLAGSTGRASLREVGNLFLYMDLILMLWAVFNFGFGVSIF